jgi:hypothetical protein
MKLNHQDLLNSYDRLFHVSEEAGITRFDPRPSPSELPGLAGDVVFAISGKLLHNYLLTRDCPRVTFYKTAKTTQADKVQFFGTSSAEFIIIVESGWYQRIKDTTLYIYEFHTEDFTVIDEVAGYYVSYKPVIPAQVHMIDDCVAALLTGNVELRFTPSLTRIADAIKASSLNYSIIRMRNAVK